MAFCVYFPPRRSKLTLASRSMNLSLLTSALLQPALLMVRGHHYRHTPWALLPQL